MASPIWSITLKNCTTILLLVVVLHFGGSNGAADSTQDQSSKCSCDEALINRQGFPNGFIFGAGSSAYQTEGGFDENGKGPGMWDNYTHTYPDKILDQSNGDVAAGSYHHYKEDVRLLKNMGVDAYKFSISWPRILPGGSIRKGVNRDGIDYYNNLINTLVANGIEPWVTILHLDTPQALEDEYGGFLSTQILADFQDFADLLFSEFGDRVKYWITVNEPWALSVLGYTRGVFAPGRCSHWMEGNCATGDSAVEPYIVMHNQLLAHAATVKLYRQKYQESQKGKIGIVVNSFWLVPYDDKEENIKATARALDFMIGWNMEPITFGRYPMSMQERVGSRLPKFTEEEAELLKGSFDFLGVNYYSGSYAFDVPNTNTNQVSYLTDSESDITGVKDGVPIGEKGSTVRTYYAYPKGLRKILHYIKENYGNSLIYITENGYDEDDKPLPLALQDYKRKDYFVDHLCCLREAIEKDGANVKGFFTWSLTDNFGYMSGYLVRFGLHYVDFTNKSLRRYPKYSARWFKQILRGGIKGPESTRISDQ